MDLIGVENISKDFKSPWFSVGLGGIQLPFLIPEISISGTFSLYWPIILFLALSYWNVPDEKIMMASQSS